MKQSILATDRAVYEKRLRRNILLCSFVFCAIVALHVVCTCLRTEQNHTYMLLANIGTDILGGSFLIGYLSTGVLPQKKLLQLYDLANQETAGQVLALGDTVTHYIGVDCYEVCLEKRRLFLPAGTMALSVGTNYRFRLKGNLIVEVTPDAKS